MPIKINYRFLVTALCILVLAISTIISIGGIQNKTHIHSFFYHDKFIPAIENLSNFIPEGERVLVSHRHSYITFYVSRDTVPIPDDITSEKSLLYYMVKNNISYIFNYDNRYFYPPNSLFSDTTLKNFSNDFHTVVDYQFGDKLKLQLYRVNNNWTFQK